MKERTAVLLVPHREGCHAVAAVERGDWNTPWAFLNGDTSFRNRAGNQTPKRRGYSMWVHFKCNDTKCAAVKAVQNDAIVDIGDEEL